MSPSKNQKAEEREMKGAAEDDKAKSSGSHTGPGTDTQSGSSGTQLSSTSAGQGTVTTEEQSGSKQIPKLAEANAILKGLLASPIKGSRKRGPTDASNSEEDEDDATLSTKKRNPPLLLANAVLQGIDELGLDAAKLADEALAEPRRPSISVTAATDPAEDISDADKNLAQN